MGLVTDPYTFTNGTVADATQVNARFQAILAQLNGNLDNTNIATGANIDGSKLLAASVDGSKLLAASVDGSKLIDKTVALLKLGMAAGVSATGSFVGGATMTGTIPHGLGVAPSKAWLICGDIATFAAVNSAVAISVIGLDAANVSWRANIVSGSQSNNSTPIYWLALI